MMMRDLRVEPDFRHLRSLVNAASTTKALLVQTKLP